MSIASMPLTIQVDVRSLWSQVPSILQTIILVVLALCFSFVFTRIGVFVIRKVFHKTTKFKFGPKPQKMRTLATLTISVWRYFMYFVAAFLTLGAFGVGVSLNSILTTAGIGGIVLGLGAQSFFKDIINGAFLLIEDQFDVGDYVELGDVAGTVEAVSLRTTRIKTFTGELNILPNSRIEKVVNLSRDQVLAVVDMTVSQEQDVQRVLDALQTVCVDFENHENLTEVPKVLGVVGFTELGATLRMVARCKPLLHWEMQRILRKAVWEVFQAQKIAWPSAKGVKR